MQADVAPKGRRFRSTLLQWTIPYVDDRRLVYVARSLGPSFDPVGAAALFVEALCCAIDGGFVVYVPGTPFARVTQGVGVIASFLVWRIYVWGVWTAPYVARIERARRVVIDAEGEEPAIRVAQPWSRQLLRVTAGARALVRATINTRDHLFLVLGPRVFELWCSEITKTGLGPVDSDWTEETLSGGEGSRALGPPVPGAGGARRGGDGWTAPEHRSVRLTPAIDAICRLLRFSPAQEIRADGPMLDNGERGIFLGVGALLSAFGGIVTWNLASWLGRAVEGVDPAGPSGLGAAAGAGIGVALALLQWAYARLWLRRHIVEPVDAFAARLVAEAARVSPPSEGGTPYRGDG